ncbi:phosphomannomutase [Microvirga roseola]|uniref:phosphomannomutase n=1 Tax=Microvirga roseola TaxID=2883126 RepID=UPI001E53A1E3|nr:phosphomannomutase [Microvirga roseola]
MDGAPKSGHSSVKFGTSGLRGLVTDLCGVPAYAYTRAFAEMLKQDGSAALAQNTVLIGRDLRGSSPEIARLCAAALLDSGLMPQDCGELPTPALAYDGKRLGRPAIMVTGSHIPEDRNGLKFYRTLGEIDKNDEQTISAWHARLAIGAVPSRPGSDDRRAPESDPLASYKSRYLDFFRHRALAGLAVGIYQHSSVARDLLVEMIEALGARAVPLGRADRFIPVDTEALREEDRVLVRRWAEEASLDAIVSTDGDADRPLIADGTGNFLRGDLVGAITAKFLKADTVVTPVTSNSALEEGGSFARVVRTRVGSPYVIAGMTEAAVSSQGRTIVGFEANGGVLLGTEAVRNERQLSALPTRDAMLPILCILAEVVERGETLAQIGSGFHFKAALSDRLENVATEKSAAFVSRLSKDKNFLEQILAPLGALAQRDDRDGLRLIADTGDVLHFRPSGNAPELRVYVEASTPERAEKLLSWGIAAAEQYTR